MGTWVGLLPRAQYVDLVRTLYLLESIRYANPAAVGATLAALVGQIRSSFSEEHVSRDGERHVAFARGAEVLRLCAKTHEPGEELFQLRG